MRVHRAPARRGNAVRQHAWLPQRAHRRQGGGRCGHPGAGKCIKPFALPDIWDEHNINEDKNGNLWPDRPQEDWQCDPVATTRQNKAVPADHYRGYQDPNPSNTGTETGWGSSFRNNLVLGGAKYHDDFGRRIVLKPNNPNQAPAPGFFMAWDLEPDQHGGNTYRENI